MTIICCAGKNKMRKNHGYSTTANLDRNITAKYRIFENDAKKIFNIIYKL